MMRLSNFTSFIALPVALSPALAQAQATATTATSALPATDLGANILQMVLGLALVIALLIGSLWLLKRLSAPRGEAAGLLRVVAGTAVGPRERVVILEIGSTWMVLGVAPGQVSALAEIPRSSLPPSAPPAAGDAAGWFKQFLDRRHARQ